jgi:hypothetical protein
MQSHLAEQGANCGDAVHEPIVGDPGEAHSGMLRLLMDGKERRSRNEGHFGLGQ